MITCKENEIAEEKIEEDYDYMNEESFEESADFEDEEPDYCD